MIDNTTVKWMTKPEAIGRKFDEMDELRISGPAPYPLQESIRCRANGYEFP